MNSCKFMQAQAKYMMITYPYAHGVGLCHIKLAAAKNHLAEVK